MQEALNSRFDAAAAEWDKKQTRVDMATKITSQIIKNIPLQNSHVVMDFGCGTGLVGLNIAPLVSKLVGVDISSGMLERFSQKAEESGLANVEAKSVSEDSLGVKNGEFDSIVSAMALHHVKEPSRVLREFAASLKQNGYLGIADLAKEDGSFHENNDGVYHFGFSEEEFCALFCEAGFEKPKVVVAHTIYRDEKSYEILFCFAKKAQQV